MTYESDFHETFTDDLLYQSSQLCKVSNHSDVRNGFYRPISETTFWSVNYQHDVIKIWNFVKIFSAIRAICWYNFIKIAVTVFQFKIFLFLGSVPFWFVKCTFAWKKIGNHAYFLPKSINFPIMYKNCFEQKNCTELFSVTIQTALFRLTSYFY